MRIRFAAAALIAVASMGCATLNVRSYAERGAAFTRYHTYTWGPADELTTGDPRLDANPFFHGRIQADVEQRLAARGFEKVQSGSADLTVHYHANLRQRVDVGGVDRGFGYCDADECRPYVSEAGTVTIDLVDARTRRLVWRGWVEGTLDGVVDNQSWMERKIDDAVARIVDTIPRQ